MAPRERLRELADGRLTGAKVTLSTKYGISAVAESPGEQIARVVIGPISPQMRLSLPGARRSVREPLDSYGSRCSAVSMTELPVGEECWIYSAQPVKPVSCPLGLPTQLRELAARPAECGGSLEAG